MLEEICEQFCFEGNFIYAEPYGCGHINDTYAVYYNRIEKSPIRYILQKINTDIFDPDDLMSNISLVTEYLKKIIISRTIAEPPSHLQQSVVHLRPAVEVSDTQAFKRKTSRKTVSANSNHAKPDVFMTMIIQPG